MFLNYLYMSKIYSNFVGKIPLSGIDYISN